MAVALGDREPDREGEADGRTEADGDELPLIEAVGGADGVAAVEEDREGEAAAESDRVRDGVALPVLIDE